MPPHALLQRVRQPARCRLFEGIQQDIPIYFYTPRGRAGQSR